jgi:predicted permease
MLLFAIGGAAGFVLARGLTSLLVTWMSALPFPVVLSLTLDSRVIAFTTGMSLLAALASGLAPALQTSAAHPAGALKDEAQGFSSRSRLRHAFVIAQVALSVTLVVGTGLFARALARAGALDPGYDPRGIELTTVDLSMGRYSEAAALAFWRSLLDRVRELPGVQDATIARVLPGGFESMELGLGLPGGATTDQDFQPDSNMVEPGYFATLRIPIIAGRDFNTGDRAGGQPVAIVGETAARRFWPGQSALGKYLSQRTASGTRAYLVVGVAGEIRSTSLIDGMSQSFVYVPVQQQGSNLTSSLTIITRARQGESVANAVRKLVGSMDPELPIAATPTLAESVALGLMPQRMAASIAGSLGTVGLVLAAIGIYGVTAFTVARRLREFGIRVALGARRSDIFRIVLRQGLGLTFAGCAIGVVLAAAVAHLLSIFLLGVPVLDPLAFAGAVTLFVVAGLGACYGPARRATGLDPLSALRCD